MEEGAGLVETDLAAVAAVMAAEAEAAVEGGCKAAATAEEGMAADWRR